MRRCVAMEAAKKRVIQRNKIMQLMEVHADILAMCKASDKDKRDRIKWAHAREVFFDRQPTALADGWRLLRQCDHEDAVFLMSLFPNGVPASRAEAMDVFLAARHPADGDEDMRCVCWAAVCGAETKAELLSRAAEAGHGWAQVLYAFYCKGVKRIEWWEKAAAQGERGAMLSLVSPATFTSSVKESDMLLEAAMLGSARAQFLLARTLDADSVECFQWLRRAAIQCDKGVPEPLQLIMTSVHAQLKLFDKSGNGRCVFEIGAALWAVRSRSAMVFLPDKRADCEMAMELYDSWCFAASQSVLCWLWYARNEGIIKDVRMMIARLVWDCKAEWSNCRVAHLKHVATSDRPTAKDMHLAAFRMTAKRNHGLF